MTKYSNRDHYLDPATGVLKNKLGITDAAILEKQEADYAAARSYELARNPIKGKFDLAHLQAIHKHLFCDLYPWAGKLRTIDISRGDTFFSHHAHIESAARPIFKKLETEKYLAELDIVTFSDRAAHYLGEVNALHPFREGNGRAQREFINHLAYKNGYRLDWKNITQSDMIQASIESFKGDCSKFAAYIQANISKL
jgi:fido (protein-threonine AMPylation protein)